MARQSNLDVNKRSTGSLERRSALTLAGNLQKADQTDPTAGTGIKRHNAKHGGKSTLKNITGKLKKNIAKAK